jgi:hypothetical protein
MAVYKKQLQKGDIIKAHQGLISFFGDLRSHFRKNYPDFAIPSSMYYGYMDMTYFSILPESIKHRDLKIAVVFVYDTFRFEVWLAAKNKKIQTRYWELIKESGWYKYNIVPTTKGIDAIIEVILVNDPDFSDLDALTKQIERGTLDFIRDVEGFLSKNKKA